MSFRRLYDFTTTNEKVMVGMAVFGAICQGAALPAFSLIFGNVIDIIGKDQGDVMAQIQTQVLAMVGVSAGLFVIVSTWHFNLSYVSGNIAKRVRFDYMRNLLRKDIGWYDMRSPA